MEPLRSACEARGSLCTAQNDPPEKLQEVWMCFSCIIWATRRREELWERRHSVCQLCRGWGVAVVALVALTVCSHGSGVQVPSVSQWQDCDEDCLHPRVWVVVGFILSGVCSTGVSAACCVPRGPCQRPTRRDGALGFSGGQQVWERRSGSRRREVTSVAGGHLPAVAPVRGWFWYSEGTLTSGSRWSPPGFPACEASLWRSRVV